MMFRRIDRKEVLNSLSRHKDITEEFLSRVKTIPKAILENVGTEVARKAVTMSREVDADLHSHKAFLRLSISKHGILYAKTNKMSHRNEEELLFFFNRRFPLFVILIESHRGTFVIKKYPMVSTTNQSLNEALRDLEESLPELPLLNDLNGKDYRELWESFAQSQIIKGREPLKQMRNLEKRWKNTVPKDKTKRTLDSYFDWKKQN
jgi:hypothetical protein